MGVFHALKTVQMVPNRAKRHICSNLTAKAADPPRHYLITETSKQYVKSIKNYQ